MIDTPTRPRLGEMSTWWLAVALVAIAWGIRYILIDRYIFVPGGWFALDGRRVLEATESWIDGMNPYLTKGFVYSPVAILLTAPLTLLPPALAILGWIVASGTFLVAAVARTVRSPGAAIVAALATLLFIPTIADLVLANVTVALVVTCWVAMSGGRIRSGIALGVLAAAFPKPMLVPLLLWILIYRPWAGLGAAIGGGVVVLASLVVMGVAPWEAFVATLRSGGGIDAHFIGNYGLTGLAAALAPWAAIAAAIALLVSLARFGAGSSLVIAAAAGIFIAPYTGIYAALPLLLALPTLAAAVPMVAIGITALAVLTAPWAPIVGAAAIALGLLARSMPASLSGVTVERGTITR